MRYLGGKCRIAKELGAFIESQRKPGQTYFEPFVGAAWVLSKISGRRVASDINPYLIALYRALQQGWIPPDCVSEEEYQAAKFDKDGVIPDYLKGFIGFGCSFGGKWFGGYARSDNRNYASNAKNGLMKLLPLIKNVVFLSMDYREYHKFNLKNVMIYCDPPYSDSTTYSYSPDFDSVVFWDTMRSWSINNTVLISEYVAPSDFEVVWIKETRTDIRGKSGSMIPRTEKLFRYRGQNG